MRLQCVVRVVPGIVKRESRRRSLFSASRAAAVGEAEGGLTPGLLAGGAGRERRRAEPSVTLVRACFVPAPVQYFDQSLDQFSSHE